MGGLTRLVFIACLGLCVSWVQTLSSRAGWNSRLFFLMKKPSVSTSLHFPSSCCIHFLSPFSSVTLALGLLAIFKHTQAVNKTTTNQRPRADQALSLIGLDHDKILLRVVSSVTGEHRDEASRSAFSATK